MPANLSPQYYEAEESYRKAKTVEEKKAALQEMLSSIPKHKGTEKLQADIKSRLARLREESQKKKQAKGGYDPFNVEKQGAGQVVLLGYPNVGKSALLGAFSRAKVKIGDYPYTTSLPLAGMMPYEDTYVQVVDGPPVTSDSIPPGFLGTIREADALIIVVDASADECLDQLEGTLFLLQEKSVIDLSAEGEEVVAPQPFVIIASKIDLEGARDNLTLLRELKPEFEIHGVSVHGEGLPELKEIVFKMLKVIRVYGKAHGKPADLEQPFILKEGSTVLDFAEEIHKDFASKLKSALVWGSSRFDGQPVSRDYILHDKDIVELQM